MLTEVKVYEEVQLFGRLHGSFTCQYSSDDRISIVTDSGVYIFTLLGRMANQFPEFSYKKHFVQTRAGFFYSPTMYLSHHHFVKLMTMDHLDAARVPLEKMLRQFVRPTIPGPVALAWSPRGIFCRTHCIFSILNEFGTLEIYSCWMRQNGANRDQCLANVTEQMVNKYVENLDDKAESHRQRYEEYTRMLNKITVRAMVWSHLLVTTGNVDHYAVLFTGHSDGTLMAWKVDAINDKYCQSAKVTCLAELDTGLGSISAMHWCETIENAGALSIADADGRIKGYKIRFDDDNASIEFQDSVMLSEAGDGGATFMQVMYNAGFVHFMAVKRANFIVITMDGQGNIIASTRYTLDEIITGLQYYAENVVLVMTLSGHLKQLAVTCKDDSVQVEERAVPMKLDHEKFDTHGLALSHNAILMCVVASPSKFRNTTKGKKYINVFLCRNMAYDPLTMLMENFTGSLYRYWDCMEALRMACLKEKRFPWVGLDPNLNYDELSLMELKVLRHVSTLSEKMIGVVPQLREYHIKPRILLHHMVDIEMAIYRIKSLLSLQDRRGRLTAFQSSSMYIVVCFLKEMLMMDIPSKARFGERLLNEMADALESTKDLKCPPRMPQCLYCGQKIIGPSCLPPHADSRCAISMMPMGIVAAYKCPFCKCVAREEIAEEMFIVLCPYCDVPMEPKDRLLLPSLGTLVTVPDTVSSYCRADCSSDKVHADDVEDNRTEYLVLSSDDSDDMET